MASFSTPRAAGQPMPDMMQDLPLHPGRRIGFALVGLGNYALNLIAPNLLLSRHAKLTALVSGNADKAYKVGEAYGIGDQHIYSYETFDRIADDPAVDVVYIILPNTLHREWTERAFAAGKHVLCEKPMAGTVEDCEAMIDAGKRAGNKLMIGYRAQFDPYNLKAIELVRGANGEEGRIGRPLLVEASAGRKLEPDQQRDKWRALRELAGGGALYDIGIYALNGTRYLLGEEPAEVRAHFSAGSGRPGISVEEGVVWTMAFPSGATAHCTTSYQVETNHFHVLGTEGEVRLSPATSYFNRNLFLKQGQKEQQISIDQSNQFTAMLDEMALSVLENRPPKTPGEEGLRDVRLMEAIYEAAESGRTVKVGG